MVDTIGMVNAVGGVPSYNGRKLRQLNGVGFAGATAARPLGARSGVRPGTPATTVTATSTTWTCQPFAGLLDGQSAAESGPYTFAFDAVATGAIAAASASIARVDIIYVQIDDPSESDGSSVPAATRKYLAGTVAGTPPATPARSIVIARINVPISGGGAPTVTWVAPYCAAAGGTVDFNTKAELDAWLTATPWQKAKVLATGAEYAWDGAAWAATGETDWVTWSTAPTALAVGTGGSAAMVQRYKRINGRFYFEYRYTLGTSGASVGTGPTINLPFPVALLNPQGAMTTGDGAIYDASVPSTPAFTKVILQSSTKAGIFTYNGATGNITATIPMAFAAGDIISGGFWADPA